MNSEKKTKKKRFDTTWWIDKSIELTIFILGFIIALTIDDIRDRNQVKQLKEHYLDVVQEDLRKDRIDYENAYEHDSLRREGCDYVLNWIIKRQNSALHSYGVLKHNTQAHIGPGFDFDEGDAFQKGDTIQIIKEKVGWYMDSSGYWFNKQIIKSINNEFDWFSAEVSDSVKNKLRDFEHYIDQTKSVFQRKTGYKGLISQNTSSFLNTTSVETKLSDYYNFGDYLNWLEDYYRDKHFLEYSSLRYSYGKTGMYKFLYLLNNEQNNELIKHLTLASIQSEKEMRYYIKALNMNQELIDLIEDFKPGKE